MRDVLGLVVGLAVGVPAGWLLAEVRRGWQAGRESVDGPPFAPELVGVPRQSGEPEWFTT